MSTNWEAYSSYNNLLRTWFVAFGIGVPATFLINDGLVKYISPGTGNPTIFKLFLFGAGAQVLMASINKVINWCEYYKLDEFKDNPVGFWQGSADIISRASNWFLIDIVFDLITMICFSIAIWELFELVAN